MESKVVWSKFLMSCQPGWPAATSAINLKLTFVYLTRKGHSFIQYFSSRCLTSCFCKGTVHVFLPASRFSSFALFQASRFFKLRAFSSDVSFTSHLHLRVIVDAQLMRGNPRRTVISLFSRVSEYQFENEIHPTFFMVQTADQK